MCHRIGDVDRFFLGALTRLAVLAQFVRARASVRVVLQAQPPPLVAALLEAFGVTRDRVLAAPTCARRVYVPEPAGCGAPSRTMSLMLQRELWRAVAAPLAPGGEPYPWARPLRQRFVLLVERAGPNRVANFDELHEALRLRLQTNYDVAVRAPPAPSRMRLCV